MTSMRWAEASHAADILQCTGQPPTADSSLAPDARSAEVEIPGFRAAVDIFRQKPLDGLGQQQICLPVVVFCGSLFSVVYSNNRKATTLLTPGTGELRNEDETGWLSFDLSLGNTEGHFSFIICCNILHG